MLLYGNEMLLYLRPKVSNLVPPKIKESETEIFPKKLKNEILIDVQVGPAKILLET